MKFNWFVFESKYSIIVFQIYCRNSFSNFVNIRSSFFDIEKQYMFVRVRQCFVALTKIDVWNRINLNLSKLFRRYFYQKNIVETSIFYRKRNNDRFVITWNVLIFFILLFIEIINWIYFNIIFIVVDACLIIMTITNNSWI